MNMVGVPAVAGDTGSGTALEASATVTAREAQRAPGTKGRSAPVSGLPARASKPGRPLILATELHPQVPAPWYRAHRPCVHCVARVLRRVERRDGTSFLRVQHASDCKVGA